jgi:hypothetical protein
MNRPEALGLLIKEFKAESFEDALNERAIKMFLGRTSPLFRFGFWIGSIDLVCVILVRRMFHR